MRLLVTRQSCATLVCAAVAGCITTVNPVRFEPFATAPVLEARSEGCAVDIVEDGTPFTKPHQEIGTVVLEWSAAQMREQGPESALKTLRTTACERGAHAVLHMRALPRGFNEGMVYEGVLVVLLDEKGEPVVGHTTGSAQSHGGSP